MYHFHDSGTVKALEIILQANLRLRESVAGIWERFQTLVDR